MAHRTGTSLLVMAMALLTANQAFAQARAANTAANMPTNANVAYTGPTVNFSLGNPAAVPQSLFSSEKKYSLLLDLGSWSTSRLLRTMPDLTLYYRLSSNLIFNLATTQNTPPEVLLADFTPADGGTGSSITWTGRQSWAMGLTYRYSPALRLGIAVRTLGFTTRAREATPGLYTSYPPGIIQSYYGIDLGAHYQMKNLTLGVVLQEYVKMDSPEYVDGAAYFGLSDGVKTAPNVRLAPRRNAKFGLAWDVLPKTKSQLLADVNTLGEYALGVRQGVFSNTTFMAGWARKLHPLYENLKNDILSAGLEFKFGNVVLSGSVARFLKPDNWGSSAPYFSTLSNSNGEYKFFLLDQTVFRLNLGLSR